MAVQTSHSDRYPRLSALYLEYDLLSPWTLHPALSFSAEEVGLQTPYQDDDATGKFRAKSLLYPNLPKRLGKRL